MSEELDSLDGVRTAAVNEFHVAGALVSIAITVDKHGQIRMNTRAPKGHEHLIKHALDGMLQGIAIKETQAAIDGINPRLALAISSGLN